MRIVIICCIASFWVSNIQSQEIYKGVVKGRVYNVKNNEPVSFANVIVFGTSIGVLTDENGSFLLSNLKPGYIQLKVTSIGYKSHLSDELLVTNARIVDFDIALEVVSVQLNEIVVNGQSLIRKEESPVSLRSIGIAEIEKNPGSNRDISKVIQTLPGVSSTTAYRNDVIVRGGGSSENRFYLDGIEIPTINHFSTQGASGGPVGILNVDFIREVNFYSSAFPSDKGNALSCVIEFKQIDGNREKLKIKGAIGASDIGLTLDGPIGKSKNTTFVFSARRSYLQFLFSALGLPFLPTYNDAQFKVKIKLNEKNSLTIIGLGAIDEFKLNFDANKTADQRYILGYLPVNEQWSYTVGTVYKHFGTNSYQTLVVSRNFLNNTSYKYRNNVEVDSLKNFDYSSYELENKIRFTNNQNLDNGIKLNYGGNAEFAKYHNATFNKSFLYGEPFVINYLSNLSVLKYGVFAEATKSIFNNRLSVSAGVRADGSNYSSLMANPLKTISPHLALSYSLSKNLFINVNVGRYHQIPAYTILGFRNSTGELINKNNGITYTSVDHMVAGIEYLPRENSKISMEGFYKIYRNYPFSVKDSVAISSKGADFGTFGDEEIKTISKGRAYGFELFYQNNDIKNTHIILSYTLVRSEFQNAFGNYIPTAWDNKHLLNITASRNFSHNWRIGVKWRFVGGAPYTPYDFLTSSNKAAWDASGKAYLDYDKFNSLRLKSFHQLDLRIDKEYFFNKWTLNIYVDVQNLYDFKAQEPDHLIIDEANPLKDPNHYNLQTIKSTTGTILPTIGIIAEF